MEYLFLEFIAIVQCKAATGVEKGIIYRIVHQPIGGGYAQQVLFDPQ